MMLSLEQSIDIIRYCIEGVALIIGISVGEHGRIEFQRSRQKLAVGWPSVEGTIQWAKAYQEPGSFRFVVALTYSYFVGEYRSGDFAQPFGKESDADAFAREMRDRKVQIRYKESDPDISILDRGAIEQVVTSAPGGLLTCRSAK